MAKVLLEYKTVRALHISFSNLGKVRTGSPSETNDNKDENKIMKYHTCTYRIGHEAYLQN